MDRTDISALNNDEQYREIRTNLMLGKLSQGAQCIIFTAIHSMKNKSDSIVKVAISMTQIEKRVLLIDADFQSEDIAHILNLSGAGLVNVLDKTCSLNKVIHKDVLTHLDVLTCGSSDIALTDLLCSSQLTPFLEQAKQLYDYIFINTAPILTSSEVAILSHFLDGVVIIMPYGKVTVEDACEAKKRLENVQGKVLGVILNDIPKGKNINMM